MAAISAEVFLVGSGSLAEAVVNGLSQTSIGSFRVAIIGRSLAKVSRLALIANARAAILRAPVTFVALESAGFEYAQGFAIADCGKVGEKMRAPQGSPPPEGCREAIAKHVREAREVRG